MNGTSVPGATSLENALAQADIVILVQPHKEFLEAADVIQQSSVVALDTTGKFTGTNIERL